MTGADQLTVLALAAGRGDRDALAEFIRLSQDSVWRFIAHQAGREVADDLTQETYLRMLAAIGSFKGRSRATTWLLAIARRVVVDRVRYDLARPRTVPMDGFDRPCAEEQLTAGEVVALLAGLDPERREALVLTALMGHSYQEAAEICGCAIGTIRSRVARARADLVAVLSSESPVLC